MILCCGEALIDMIQSVTDTGEPCFVPHSGGAVFNTAIALGRLRAPSSFLTGLSTDLFGDQLRLSLSESHVDTSLAVISDKPTTLAFVRLTEGQASYTFYDENTAGRELYPEQLPSLPDDVHALYFGGISLISEPCAEFYAALAVREAAKRVTVLDPNIRIGFVQDTERYRERLNCMIANTDILKVSDEDLAWIVPGTDPLRVKVHNMLKIGPKIVILTKGSDGASAFLSNGKVVEVPAQRVELVDAVGAGDTFNAGVLAKLAENGFLQKDSLNQIAEDDVREALEFGAAVAAVTVSRSGANPPWAHELPE
ncbi:MAG: carbohydrate kinase [Paracoccaceae bacterium]